MATARTSFPRPNTSRPGRTARRVVLAVAAAIGVGLAPLPASAAPGDPATSQEAAELMAARAHDLEVVTEQFNTARETLVAQQSAAKAAADTFAQAQAQLAAAQAQVSGIARSAYAGEALNGFSAMMTSDDAEDFIGRMSTMSVVADHQGEQLAQAVAAGRVAAEAQSAAAKTASDAQATFDDVAAQQADLQAQINAYQDDFARLSAQEQRAATQLASGGGAEASRADREALAAGPVVASSEAAQVAVDTAMAQLGKPYVWAAAGPGSFDCSGLTMYAYQAAGVALPHSSGMQARMGRAVSRAELQPGDLVAFNSPVSHIGIYIGNGQMVNAPTSGDVVRVASIDGGFGTITAMRRVAG